MYPNKFIYSYGVNTLSLNAHKLFLETINLIHRRVFRLYRSVEIFL